MRRAELAFIAVVLTFLGAVFLLDAAIPAKPERINSSASTPFISTGWYCPAPSSESTKPVLSIANLGSRSTRLRGLAVGEGRESASAVATVRGRRSAQSPLADFKVPEAVGISEAFGAATAADLTVLATDKGVASSRCSGEPSVRWLFGTASTVRRHDNHLLVANPFEEEAVITVRIFSPEKDMVPARLKDVVIPALSQKDLFLSDYITETASFGIELSATQGRVIASRFSSVATRDSVRGISLDIGAVDPALMWTFAGGEVPQDGEELMAITNPGAREALIEMTFQTDEDQIAPPALEELAVPPGRQVNVKISDHLPRGTKHATQLISSNRVPVVAERQTSAATDGGRGFENTFGNSRSGKLWAVGAGSAAGGSESLAITNTGRQIARVSVSILTEKAEAKPPELAAVRVAPGRRSTIDLTPYLAGQTGTAVIRASSGSVNVERLLTLRPPYADFASSPGQRLE